MLDGGSSANICKNHQLPRLLTWPGYMCWSIDKFTIAAKRYYRLSVSALQSGKACHTISKLDEQMRVACSRKGARVRTSESVPYQENGC